jgi:hypothetical protein
LSRPRRLPAHRANKGCEHVLAGQQARGALFGHGTQAVELIRQPR